MAKTLSTLKLFVVAAPAVLAGCGENAAPDDMVNPPRAEEVAPIVPASEAVSGADVPTLDPATMVDAEIAKVLGGPPGCTFRYTSAGNPVLALGAGDGPITGAMKLAGKMIRLSATVAEGGVRAEDPPVRISVNPEGDPRGGSVEAEMVFEIGDQLRVGYGGYLQCAR
ncbi:hypothetical protein ABID21_002503 [Pseudorhizobium tarimense]|uniref:DUF6692 domain-containing protein n=1 Tax=Pseudorhizobium tarimense TaxID=1079109 RepID=A0ABV2H772_9HYPH|nr:DUF6692 family protein [Pseudorhizobium tarimense]MCJ8519762.1 hypothetical protein [Pseudorhizobium tarimense]